jgi:hypothetical protein
MIPSCLSHDCTSFKRHGAIDAGCAHWHYDPLLDMTLGGDIGYSWKRERSLNNVGFQFLNKAAEWKEEKCGWSR